jgi:hypothetical protein
MCAAKVQESFTLEWTRLAASGSNVETLFLGKSVLKLRHLKSRLRQNLCGIPGLEVINGRALKPI